ncbi:MAG: hypothetical protein HUU56_11045 [Bdellovibrionaceae bacterium]|nr:hypothetical protein [Pseudobdellovibrionaceae bacterium]
MIFLLQISVKATERIEFFNGVRSLAMGNTQVATVNDETALAANPAGLGKLRNFFGTIFDPELDLGSSAMNLYRGKSFSNPFSISQVLPSVAKSPGDYYYARGQLFPSFVAKNFGIGILGKYELNALAESDTSVNTFYRDDLALLLGYNFRFWDGRIKIGFTGKMVSRIELNETTLDSTAVLDNATLASTGKLKQGLGIGADLGLMMTAPWSNLPTIGVVLRDIGNTSYDKSYFSRLSATEKPTPTSQDADVGVSFQVIHKPNIRTIWSLEYKGVLTAKDEEDKQKLYHAGMEVNLGDVFFIRFGYNQRYLTGGFELASERFQFQIASYGEEVGTSSSTKEDRRTVAKFSFRF